MTPPNYSIDYLLNNLSSLKLYTNSYEKLIRFTGCGSKGEVLTVGDRVYISDYPLRKEAKQVAPEHFVRSLLKFEPIPLTLKILKKNGFNNSPFESNKKFQYVHELQHALKQCGIDKEIVI